MGHVYARTSAVVTTTAGTIVAVKAGARYEADDPLVRERPELFDQPVEEATANPGQRRNATRAR